MKKLKYLIPFFFLGIVVCSQGESKKTRKSLSKAPDFTLETLQGEKFHLYDYLGNVIIIDFWDTWCPPCRAEIPHFIELYSKYQNKGFLMIGIAFARQGKETVKSFAENQGINYPLLLATREVVRAYGGISVIPTTFIINKRGEIVEKVIGYRDKEFFEEKITQLLAEENE